MEEESIESNTSSPSAAFQLLPPRVEVGKLNSFIFVVVGLLTLLTVGCQTVGTGSSRLQVSASLVDFGVSSNTETGVFQTADGMTVHSSTNSTILQKTDRISAEIGTKFGIMFIVRASADVSDKNLKVVIVHPPISYQKDFGTVTVSTWSTKFETNKVLYKGFSFDTPEELQKGKWTISIVYENTEILSKEFVVE